MPKGKKKKTLLLRFKNTAIAKLKKKKRIEKEEARVAFLKCGYRLRI